MKYVAALLAVITAVMANYLYKDYLAEEKKEAEAHAARKEIDPRNVKTSRGIAKRKQHSRFAIPGATKGLKKT
jgi:hypothetical protein